MQSVLLAPLPLLSVWALKFVALLFSCPVNYRQAPHGHIVAFNCTKHLMSCKAEVSRPKPPSSLSSPSTPTYLPLYLPHHVQCLLGTLLQLNASKAKHFITLSVEFWGVFGAKLSNRFVWASEQSNTKRLVAMHSRDFLLIQLWGLFMFPSTSVKNYRAV